MRPFGLLALLASSLWASALRSAPRLGPRPAGPRGGTLRRRGLGQRCAAQQTAPVHEAKDEMTTGRKHFIREIVETDLRTGAVPRVITRFPPEPNGFLHVGHAKSICLNFGLAREYDGAAHMRLDDTNPEKEDEAYTDAILDDVRWLVGPPTSDESDPWEGPVRYASDYFDQMYQFASHLISKNEAYVDSQTAEEMRRTRGTLTEPGVDSPYRDERSVADNLALFEKMRRGDLEEGSAVLRAKIDMASPNLNLRDPALYRIKKLPHARTKDEWPMYPMYDFAHAVSDAVEGITHSLCTLEFEDHRPLYEWVVDRYCAWASSKTKPPRQIEFSRLALKDTVTSKRKLNALVASGAVDGWSDARMPTIAGMRKKGVPAAAVRLFCERIGISKADSVIDPKLIDECVRAVLEPSVPRAFCVLDPVPVMLSDFPEEDVFTDVPRWPSTTETAADFRTLRFGGADKKHFIDAADVWDVEQRGPPPKGFKRLVATPGGRVRLRYAYVIRCDAVERDEATGEISKLVCSVERDSRAGAKPSKGKVGGIVHWLREDDATVVPVALYEGLFLGDDVNPTARTLKTHALVETSALAHAETAPRVQFERVGYFNVADSETLCHRIAPLKDGFATVANKAPAVTKQTTQKKKISKSDELEKEAQAAARLDLRTALVTGATPHPESDDLWCLSVDLAEDAPRPVAAKIRSVFASAEDVVGRRVIVLANTKPRSVAGFQSHGMLLVATDDTASQLHLLEPPADAPLGTRLLFTGCDDIDPAPPSQVKNKKLWETAQPALSLRPADGALLLCGDRPLQHANVPCRVVKLDDDDDDDPSGGLASWRIQ